MPTGTSANELRDGATSFKKVLAFIGIFTTITVTITALAGSKSLTLLTSWLVNNEENQVGVHVRVAVATFHFITNGFHMFAFWLQCTSVVSFSSEMASMLDEIAWRMERKGGFGSKVILDRMGKQLMRDYRTLAVLQANFAGFFKHYIFVLQMASIFSVVKNAYQAVVGGSPRSLLLAFAVFFGRIKFIEVTEHVHDNSANLLLRWKRMSSGHVPFWFPKFLKSCRHVCVPVGSFFYIDRGLALTIFSIVTNASASLILANRAVLSIV